MNATRPRLSWGLLIATKDRPDALRTCLRLALRQTRPPAEIIIVDASDDWATLAEEVAALVNAADPLPRLVHVPAPVPSLTVQRNAALDRATADIVFLIDDDSFLYPDCAERILEIYEADAESAVAGIQAALAPPLPDLGPDQRAAPPDLQAGINARPGPLRWIVRRLVPMGEEAFVPYDGKWAEISVPEALAGFDLRPARLFEGCRMTFRRAVIDRERFEPLLRYYCPGEDLDASYRASRHGALLTARAARLHHSESPAARLKRYQVMLLRMSNRAVFLWRNLPDRDRARSLYRRQMRRRLVAEIVKDLARRRFDFPHTRAVAHAWRLSGEIFARDEAALREWYPVRQAEIVRKG